MTRKWLLALAVGAGTLSAVPALALDDIRGPLSPAGGYSNATAAAASNEGNDRMVRNGGGFGFLSQWATGADDIRGPLSPSSSDS